MKKNINMLLIAAMLITGLSTKSQAVFTVVNSGNWGASSTWVRTSGSDADGIPDNNDDVTINNNRDVTVTAAAACRNLVVQGNTRNDTVFLSVNSGATLSVGGTFSIGTTQTRRFAGLDIKGTIQFANTVSFSRSRVTYRFDPASVIEFMGGNQSVPNLPGTLTYPNLVLSGSGNKGLGSRVRVGVSLSLRGTAAVSTNAVIYSAGALLEYNNTNAQTTNNNNFPTTNPPASLVIKSAAGVTLHAARNITNLTLTTGDFLLGSNTLSIAGNITRTSGRINAANATLNFNGTAAQTIAAGSFAAATVRNITVNSPAGLQLNESVAVTGALTVNAGMLFKPAASAIISGSGQVTGAGTIHVTRIAGANTLSTQYALVRNLTNLTTEYAGTAQQSANAGTYTKLKISNAANVLLVGNTTVSGLLTLETGGLTIGANTLTINGTVSRNAGFLMGSPSSNLVIGANAGTLYFATTGTGNQLKNFTLNNGATATLGSSLVITGGTAVNTEGLLTVTGTAVLTTGGLLTIGSNQYGTASIAAGRTSGGYISGNVTVERYIPQNASKSWRLLASNTSGQTIRDAWQEGQQPLANLTPGYGTMIPSPGANLTAVQALGFDSLSAGASLYRFNQSGDNLEAVANTNNTQLSSQPGYFLFVRGNRSAGQMGAAAGNAATTATTLRSTGAIYQGNQATITVPANTQALIRNPFASAIDLNNVVLTGGLVKAFKVWDPKLNGAFGTGAYQTFAKIGANFLVTPGSGSFGASGSANNIVESGCAFFVQAVGTAGTITINENAKVTGSKLVFRPSTTQAEETMLMTNLFMVRNNVADLVDGNLLVFDNTSSDSVNVDDVKKSSNFGENISIFKDAANLAVERRPVPATDDSVAYRLYKMKRADYKLQIIPVNMALPGMIYLLQDRYLGTLTAIGSTDTSWYSFTVNANAASAAQDRFTLLLKHSAPLPVSFIAITAAIQGNTATVNWKVDNEIDLLHYQVERSADGRNFDAIGNPVVAKGDGLAYHLTDASITDGVNYYRVKAIDLSGNYQFSAVVKVVKTIKDAGFAISPNPVKGKSFQLQFKPVSGGKYTVQLMNSTGQKIMESSGKLVTGAVQLPIQVPAGIPPGIYQVRFTATGLDPVVEQLVVTDN